MKDPVIGERRAHPRIALNALSLEPGPLDVQVDTVARLGVSLITPVDRDVHAFGLPESARAIRDAGLGVAALTCTGFAFATPEEAEAGRRRMDRAIETAQAIGAPAICMTTGPRGALSWPEAARRFAEEIAPCAERARAAGVALSVEPVSHLFAHISIVHRLADVVALVKAAGINLAVDVFACWVDSDLDAALESAAPLCSFVQISDYCYGDHALPCRAPLGDGVVPLQRIASRITKAGFAGPFDIEILGPRIAQDREAGLKRSIAKLNAIIETAEA
jgi:sugar phosphate isomerase/epimerase